MADRSHPDLLAPASALGIERHAGARDDDAAISCGLALREFCATQVQHIATALQDSSHRHRRVHEARKGIRRLRSALALGAPCFQSAPDIDRSLRRLGRSLSRLRDAHVAVELGRARLPRAEDAQRRAIWQAAVAQLTEARADTLRDSLRKDARFAQRRKRLQHIGAAIAALPWRALDTATIAAQLARSRKRADRAAARCTNEAGLKRLHGLRKRLRRHRMQVAALTELLAADAPAPVHAAPGFRASVAAYAGTLDEVSRRVDAIGARLDARLLRRALRRLAPGAQRAAVLAQLARETR